MHPLEWDNAQIPHKLWIETTIHGRAMLCLSVVKDLEPEHLHLELNATPADVIQAWQGKAIPVSNEYQDEHLYSQVRSLMTLAEGCVLWMVNHIQLPDGNKMSADKLVLIPHMKESNSALIPA